MGCNTSQNYVQLNEEYEGNIKKFKFSEIIQKFGKIFRPSQLQGDLEYYRNYLFEDECKYYLKFDLQKEKNLKKIEKNLKNIQNLKLKIKEKEPKAEFSFNLDYEKKILYIFMNMECVFLSCFHDKIKAISSNLYKGTLIFNAFNINNEVIMKPLQLNNTIPKFNISFQKSSDAIEKKNFDDLMKAISNNNAIQSISINQFNTSEEELLNSLAVLIKNCKYLKKLCLKNTISLKPDKIFEILSESPIKKLDKLFINGTYSNNEISFDKFPQEFEITNFQLMNIKPNYFIKNLLPLAVIKNIKILNNSYNKFNSIDEILKILENSSQSLEKLKLMGIRIPKNSDFGKIGEFYSNHKTLLKFFFSFKSYDLEGDEKQSPKFLKNLLCPIKSEVKKKLVIGFNNLDTEKELNTDEMKMDFNCDIQELGLVSSNMNEPLSVFFFSKLNPKILKYLKIRDLQLDNYECLIEFFGKCEVLETLIFKFSLSAEEVGKRLIDSICKIETLQKIDFKNNANQYLNSYFIEKSIEKKFQILKIYYINVETENPLFNFCKELSLDCDLNDSKIVDLDKFKGFKLNKFTFSNFSELKFNPFNNLFTRCRDLTEIYLRPKTKIYSSIFKYFTNLEKLEKIEITKIMIDIIDCKSIKDTILKSVTEFTLEINEVTKEGLQTIFESLRYNDKIKKFNLSGECLTDFKFNKAFSNYYAYLQTCPNLKNMIVIEHQINQKFSKFVKKLIDQTFNNNKKKQE